MDKLEVLLKKEKAQVAKASAKEFLGVLSHEEAEQMKNTIEESCGQIHEEDWK